MPDTVPEDESVSPFGNPPRVTAKLYGDVPPVAKIVWLYATPTAPVGSVVGESVIVGHTNGQDVSESTATWFRPGRGA